MALIRIDTLKCIRKKDFSGEDEPEISIAGLSVWSGKMGKGDSRSPAVERSFKDSVLVELKEKNNNSETLLGKWTVNDTPTANGNAPLTATSSGYHYEVYYDVE